MPEKSPTYVEQLLTPGYQPETQKEEADQDMVIEAFEFALKKRREAMENLLSVDWTS